MQNRIAGLMQLHIQDKAMLHACYMPYVQGGGLFIPSQQSVRMGELMTLVVALPGQAQKMMLTGPVIWISYKATGFKPKGFAIQLCGDKAEFYRTEIEKILVGLALSDRSSFTF